MRSKVTSIPLWCRGELPIPWIRLTALRCLEGRCMNHAEYCAIAPDANGLLWMHGWCFTHVSNPFKGHRRVEDRIPMIEGADA